MNPTRKMTKKTSESVSCAISLAPVPASRPRVGRFGTYYAKGYARWKKEADKMLEHKKLPTTDQPLYVEVEQICRKPPTTKRSIPFGDIDNYVKGPLDAITRADFGWVDDDQIVELHVVKRFAEPSEQPKSIVTWYEMNLNL